MEYKIGQSVRITEMFGEPRYNGREGKITYIDAMGQLHGTWGGLAIIPETDKFEITDEGTD